MCVVTMCDGPVNTIDIVRLSNDAGNSKHYQIEILI